MNSEKEQGIKNPTTGPGLEQLACTQQVFTDGFGDGSIANDVNRRGPCLDKDRVLALLRAWMLSPQERPSQKMKLLSYDSISWKIC